MQRFLTWLGNRLFPKSKPALRQGARPGPATAKKPQPAVAAVPATPVADQTPLIDFDSELGGRIEEAGPGKNVLIRNKYLREDTGTHETLKIIDESIFDTGEETGFDPYNTGQFDRSQNWNVRTWK